MYTRHVHPPWCEHHTEEQDCNIWMCFVLLSCINSLTFIFCYSREIVLQWSMLSQWRTWLCVVFTSWWMDVPLTRHMSLVEQELLNPPEHLSSPRFLVEFVLQSLVLCVCCLSFCTFYFGHCVVSTSSIYRFSLLLWYLQTPFTLNFFLLLEQSISRYHFVLISRYHFVLIKVSSFNKPPLTHLSGITLF
jgi:ABC-type uncharacterized transport system fused permease/ATPase subunit